MHIFLHAVLFFLRPPVCRYGYNVMLMVSTCDKADRHDITEILLKVALNTTILTL